MPYPVPIVEVAFNDGPYVVSPTWTDITSYVYDCEITRGRDDDWSDFYGSATLTLNNRTRLFDPFYTAGTYYGKLTPRRQIRVRATHGGTTYDVFRGYVSGWPPAWTDAGTNSTVTISCFDALQLLASTTMPVDWAASYIATLGAAHYWKCNDPIPWYSSGTIRDYGTTPVTQVVISPAYQGNQLASGLPQTSAANNDGLWLWNDIGTIAMGTAGDFTVCYWVTPTTSNAAAAQFNIGYRGYTCGISMNCTSNTANYGQITVNVSSATTPYKWTSTVKYDPSLAYHIAFTYTAASGTGVLYVNGINVTSARAAGILSAPITLETSSTVDGEFQQVCAFPSALTQANIQQIVYLSQGYIAETTSARVSRIISNTSFPAGLVSTPASPVGTSLAVDTDAPTAAYELQKTANTEYGPLFVSKTGVVTLLDQNYFTTRTNSIVSQVTYGSGGVGLGQDVTLQIDGDSMRNVANITIDGSGTVNVTNSSSVTTYSQADEDLDTQSGTVANALNIGAIITNWGGIPYPQADETEVVVRQDGTWGSTLALELTDRVTLAVAPPTGNTITYPMLLQRIRHRIVPGRWQTFIQGSARWAAVFILDQSVLDGTDLLG